MNSLFRFASTFWIVLFFVLALPASYLVSHYKTPVTGTFLQKSKVEEDNQITYQASVYFDKLGTKTLEITPDQYETYLQGQPYQSNYQSAYNSRFIDWTYCVSLFILVMIGYRLLYAFISIFVRN